SFTRRENNGRKSIALSGTTLTMVVDDFFNKTWVFTGTLAADCTVTVPQVLAGYVRRVINSTTGGFNVIIQGPTGAATAGIASGAPKVVASDGTNWNIEV